ncbi:glycerate kinase type-2 family protein [Verminephrobacter eiseniae]|uniref:Hydroxypyruvate reductase n=1 Tax=Verminephrobacter eiseniae (strain EF01-2) TaxID=391735 RepID=A1WGE9_VEREI|nr:glycerate kinase [Verminephrobacter eiseniae]ABM56706.1 Hydroxypyruvate reductase [Verminephrobacter eiseniae EF01-2]MCW5287063.1 glycerate kinase [Verminephrobacter eiseniae]MCW5305361.1 glycerate kinase [Verminephrobacter eiseniae]MCW8181918.1 glycerate kinase [Verminephrobacter eiseniae]MCW8192918.1 glycerate kinase [Verminephrobacter eiseniae]
MHPSLSAPAAAPDATSSGASSATALPDFRCRPRAFLRALFDAAVRSAQPLHGMRAWLPPPPKGRTLVLGAGKAGGAMAQALEALWPADAPLSGLVITRYGHVPPRPAGLPQRIDVVQAAHPVPDAAGLAAAQRILDLTRGLTADDLVLCLISGGGSALLSLPCDGLTLADKQRINRALLDSGAPIGAMNCVRKHLSRIKGGRLAAACLPARVVTLGISDVPGDDVSVIASGPTVPDASSCAETLALLVRYGIDLPAGIGAALQAGMLETPKPGDPRFAGHAVHLIATPWQALAAAAEAARAAGLAAHLLSDEIEGEAREVGRVHAALARSVARRGQPFARPCVILSGGETSVTVRPRAPGVPAGRGGRAGEFCLGLAQALQGQGGVWALAADTDGIDGSEDNAGVFVDPNTLARAEAQGLRCAEHLARNDAWGFFAKLDDLLLTGPTYTNVNDFRALLIL